MSESRNVEIYECQVYKRRKKWIAHEELPYHYKDSLEPCEMPYNITLPSVEWKWASEWTVLKHAGNTDEEGWEYASRMQRFQEERAPRGEPAISSYARRRLWSRVLQREIGMRPADVQKILQKTQSGLGSIHAARVRIEDIMKQAPEAAQSPQMVSLVTSVKKNIHDVILRLDQVSAYLQKELSDSTNNSSNSGGTSGGRNQMGAMNGPPANAAAIVKKLRNDVMKEEVAINKAIKAAEGKKSSTAATSGNNNNSNSSSGLVRGGSASVVTSGGKGSFVPAAAAATGQNSSSSIGNSSDGAIRSESSYREPGQRTISMELKDDIRNIDNQFRGSGMQSGSGSVVKSGAKGVFDPSVLRSSSASELGADGEPAHGVFMDRSRKELQILEKFVPVDQATVMQEIIDERHVEILKVNKGLREVNDMFKDLARLVQEQESDIQEIFQNTEMSNARTKAGLDQIIQAEHLQRTGNCAIS